jgi:hypothetical protein
MQIPNFHGGYFDGLRIGPDTLVHFFLRTADQDSFVLALGGVEALALKGIKQGNITLDLVLRSAQEITHSHSEELYGVDAGTPQVTSLWKTATERGLQVLEVNPSYGAQGLVLFETWSLNQ